MYEIREKIFGRLATFLMYPALDIKQRLIAFINLVSISCRLISTGTLSIICPQGTSAGCESSVGSLETAFGKAYLLLTVPKCLSIVGKPTKQEIRSVCKCLSARLGRLSTFLCFDSPYLFILFYFLIRQLLHSHRKRLQTTQNSFLSIQYAKCLLGILLFTKKQNIIINTYEYALSVPFFVITNKYFNKIFRNIRRLFGCLFRFYGISTFLDYLMPNPFHVDYQFYFKQFSLAWVQSLIVKNISISIYSVESNSSDSINLV